MIVLAGALVAAPAWAQQAPPPAQTPPPPPVQIPPPPPSAAEWKVTVPMSQRLVLNRGPKSGSQYWIERGGVLLTDSGLATGLETALAGSAQAVSLAHQAHQKLSTGSALAWPGAILMGVSAGTSLGFAESIGSNGGNVTTATGVGLGISLGLFVGGVALAIIAGGLSRAGSQLECDAVNAYNSDLVDGKLRSP
jgi:hypothetical protein